MILAAALLAAVPVQAAPVDCARAVVQQDMNACEAARARRADAALNAAWKRRIAASPALKPDLLTAQRIWLRFRDAECAARGKAYQGGTMQPMVVAGCYADLTEQRAKDLAALIEDH
ncbi:lysozyme inhibitor LprI family protein [Sphingomonas abietis]|uniref:Lysozyme inhibitor LprI family protein n=1 Tax=Sphingomonas abietis TaxID=3012344 RepID=A0ABY7NHZ9_9SPHN|nr:lysozyme inhibitor LprI family protein [Sphingomonas abietis]WBO21160.1 lysozyme inhibitor LprI family protein [Sphingomonas abietis]